VSRPDRSATAIARRAGPALLLCLALIGCVTTPLEKRPWVALRTAHYDIWSSLDEHQTERLAIELERFRAASEFVYGTALPREPMRTQVYAFDDRGIERPFAYQYQRTYLIPRQRGDMIVLRTGGSWEDEAWTPLKLAYARRLFWNASQQDAPPWIDEGLPQLASTVEVGGEGAAIGIPRSDHLKTLHREQWVPIERLLSSADLSGWSSLDRVMLEAESWGLCHYLLISEERRDQGKADLARFRALLAEGAAPGEAARSALGDSLQTPVRRYLFASEFDSLSVRISRTADAAPSRRPLARGEILEQLGALALAIDEPKHARTYYQRALDQDGSSVRAHAGMGDVLAALGELDAAQTHYQTALSAAPDDPLVQLGAGHVALALARASDDDTARAEHLRDARDHYQRSLALAGSLPEAHVGLARSYLVEGEDPSAGLASWSAAHELLPGDAAIDALGVELALARGDQAEAHRIAARLSARARGTTEVAAADALLARIDARADAR
jgi:Tfp pilus assembly protein PilF